MVIVSCLVGLTALFFGDTDWPNWRGPHFNGTADGAALPDKWGPEENVLWRCPLPGQSASTPAVIGDMIFLSSLDDETEELLAMSVDLSTGEVLWEHSVGKGKRPSERSRGRENSMAACSPVADSERVIFTYGNGDLVAFDLFGEQLWQRNFIEELGPLVINWGYASSPLLFDGTLYLQVLHRGDSYFFGIDPETGTDEFRVQRKNTANAESQEAYTTPVPFQNGERWEILVLGADCLTAHDPGTGQELWRWCGMNPRNRPNFRQVSNPLICDNGIIIVTSPQGNPMRGLQVNGTEIKELWTLDRMTPDVTVPTIHDGLVYAVDGRKGWLTCLRPESGEVLWQEDLQLHTFVRASPTMAAGKLYIADAEGTVAVVKAGEQFQVVGRAEFDRYPTRSSIVVVGDRLLLRTADTLFCIGDEE